MSEPILHEPVLRAGVAQQDITPPAGIDMGGFGARVQPSICVRDPLFAKALVLDNGSERVGIVSCDLLGFSNEYDLKLREAIAATGAVQADNLMIACTHNHAGPATQFLRNCGNVDEAWMAQLQLRIVEVVKRAAEVLEPVTAEYSWGRANLNHDRRARWDSDGDAGVYSGAERDTRVSIVQFKAGEKVMANLLHFSCHPVAMLGENRMFSAEYCGQATAYLERETGAATLFLNGACGNVNPLLADADGNLHPVTTYAKRSYDDVLGLGQAVGSIALRASKRGKRLYSSRLNAQMQRLEVPLQVPSLAETEAAIDFHEAGLQAENLSSTDLWIHSTYLNWAQNAKAAMQESRAPASILVAVQKISIGELTLVGVGGELFAATGKRIQKLIGAPCLVIGFANGNVGYLPTRKSFRQGGYEVVDAGRLYDLFGVGPQVEEVLINGVRQFDNELGIARCP